MMYVYCLNAPFCLSAKRLMYLRVKGHRIVANAAKLIDGGRAPRHVQNL
jgi:hypothetical protein